MDIKPLIKKIEETALDLQKVDAVEEKKEVAKKFSVYCENLRGILTKDEADHQIGLAITRANKKFKKAS